MAVYRDRRVPIPDITGITINRGDNNRVLYVLSAPYDNKVGYTRPKRITIGYVCEDDTTTMYPTNKYKTIFPAKWEKSFNETPLPIIKKMGMNVLGQAANMSCGIGDVVCEAFGNSAGKKMLDYALYSILYHSDVSSQFEARMSHQILYSGKAYSDSSYSDLFERGLTKDQILAFKKKWAMQCKKDGVDGVWLCIDGSNDDCESEGVELAEKGHAKSKRNVEIVSFTYAVTPGGKPVTFDVYLVALKFSCRLPLPVGRTPSVTADAVTPPTHTGTGSEREAEKRACPSPPSWRGASEGGGGSSPSG